MVLNELSIVAYCCKQKEKKRRKKRTIKIIFRGQSRTVNNINIKTHYHTVVTLWWNDLCLEWIFELARKFVYFFHHWEFSLPNNKVSSSSIGKSLLIRAPDNFQVQRVITPYFWKWRVFAYFLCTVILSTSEKIAYMYTFKIMFDTSVIQWTQDASEMYISV